MTNFDYSILKCPHSSERLQLVKLEEMALEKVNLPFDKKKVSHAFINASQTYLYPIVNDVILLLKHYAINLNNTDAKSNMSFDKDRVFRYYNAIDYKPKEGKTVYEDSDKFVDFREVSREYVRNSFVGVKKYIPTSGQYILDIASGPIGLQEYIGLSEGYDIRICIDISYNALVQAKNNLSKQKGIFICGDITNIPLIDNICDAVICQHTLYHVPRLQQKTAVEELYRVTRPKGKVAIVYSWFYHSWLMNITLFPLQLIRVARYFASKLYVRLFPEKPRLYFYPHSQHWFRSQFSFSKNIEFYCWRSLNKQFLKVYIHDWLFGKQILKWVRKIEEKHPKLMGRLGDYPVILINK